MAEAKAYMDPLGATRAAKRMLMLYTDLPVLADCVDALSERLMRLEDAWLEDEHIQPDGTLRATLHDAIARAKRAEAVEAATRDELFAAYTAIERAREYLSNRGSATGHVACEFAQERIQRFLSSTTASAKG